MIQIRNVQPDFQRRLVTAILKALDYASLLTRNTQTVSRDSYMVTGTSGETYFVRVLESDGEPFIFCTCDAGKHHFPCYHAAHVALLRGIIVRAGSLRFGVSRDLTALIEQAAQAATKATETKTENALLDVQLPANTNVKAGGFSFSFDKPVRLVALPVE